jgi:hypothetical protein
MEHFPYAQRAGALRVISVQIAIMFDGVASRRAISGMVAGRTVKPCK